MELQAMDGVLAMLEEFREKSGSPSCFRGLLNVVIGRKITRHDGTVVSNRLTWRQVASLLKRLRWNRDAVKELKLDPDQFPPRDRERFWYAVIGQAHVDSDEARAEGNQVAARLQSLGYLVGPPPT